MEDEYEVGEYYRTKNGEILKIVDLDEYGFLVDKFYYQIVKHSKNIIDLVEVGDYVNGKEVKQIAMFEGFPDYPKLIFTDEKHLIPGETIENKDIKTIVTHERFASIEYKVEEE